MNKEIRIPLSEFFFFNVLKVGKLKTNSIFHFRRAEGTEYSRGRGKEDRREEWEEKFHTSTDVLFTSPSQTCVMCSQLYEAKKNLYPTHMQPKGIFRHTHINIPVCQSSRKERWEAASSVQVYDLPPQPPSA